MEVVIPSDVRTWSERQAVKDSRGRFSDSHYKRWALRAMARAVRKPKQTARVQAPRRVLHTDETPVMTNGW
jgi:hypothetical protein